MILRLGLFFLSMLTCSMVWAVGFGNVETKSYLGEPLNISIPLILSAEERKSKLQVMLATQKEYQTLEQNIPKSYALLRADMIENDGELVVNISSFQAIDESFLTIILKVQRGRGNFYKRIQLILDPAWRKPNRFIHEKIEMSGASPTNTTPIASAPIQQGDPMQQSQALPPYSPSLDWARRASYGPVQSGDNLSEIAYRLRKDKRFSNHQVMLALFHANPQAFERNDINRLKQGAFIQVPKLQDVQVFFNSKDYQALEKSLDQKKKKIQKDKSTAEPTVNHQPVRKFRSRVSLGMTESLGARTESNTSISDAVVLSRLEKLEPLYDQVMSSNIRIDGIGVKVDSLAEEVRSLHQKVDALAQANGTQTNRMKNSGEKGYGWWWFLFLLILNILLLLFFLYRRQRTLWQEKLKKIQHKNIYATPESKQAPFDDVMQQSFADNVLNDDSSVPEESDVKRKPNESPFSPDFRSDFPPHPMDDDSPATLGFESANVRLADEDVKNTDIEEKNEKIHIDHATYFEVAIQKEDWREAEQHYQGMVKNVQNQPRIQASYIQMLHHEKCVRQRNNALLSLYKTYDKVKWNRFCSLFDDDIWHQLQDERVISFTGDVMEEGVERSNLAAKEMASLLAISDLDVQGTSELPAFNADTKDEQSKKSNDDVADIMDQTVVMSAKDLAQWGDAEANKLENNPSKSEEADYMDTGDVGKWGKVEETTDDDLMLEVDFDIEEELKEDKPEAGKVEFTEIDVEFTGEIEVPIEDKKK
ncbi:MAG: FimV/HubP family polar landmark protein [Ghiorsea sp.]|nr:FimV/HubP family polar landmark protein [Ghiorsea sp.]